MRARNRSLNKLHENEISKEAASRPKSTHKARQIRQSLKFNKAISVKPVIQPRQTEADSKQESLLKKLEAKKLSQELEKMQGKKPVLVLPKKKTELKKAVSSKQ